MTENANRENEVPTGLIDTRELAFWMVVDKEGVADAHANLVGYRQAAEWMRAFADRFDAKADAEDAEIEAKRYTPSGPAPNAPQVPPIAPPPPPAQEARE